MCQKVGKIVVRNFADKGEWYESGNIKIYLQLKDLRRLGMCTAMDSTVENVVNESRRIANIEDGLTIRLCVDGEVLNPGIKAREV